MRKGKSIAVATLVCFLFLGGLIMGPTAQGVEVINIATAGIGGSYYPVGAGIAKIIDQYVDGATGTAEVTGASVENMKLLGRKKVRLAFVEPAFAGLPGYLGQEPFDKKIDVRCVSSLHFSTGSTVVLKRSGFKKITDLKGKRIAVGKMGSMTTKAQEYFFKAYGMSFDDMDIRYMGHSEAADALRDGSIDAAVLVGAPPAASIMSIAATHDIDILSGDEQHMQKMKALKPGIGVFNIKKGTYKGVGHDSLVWMSGLTLLCSAEEKAELIYEIVKAMYEHRDIIEKSHPSAKVITLENAVTDFGIPFHPGAIRYYKEKGYMK